MPIVYTPAQKEVYEQFYQQGDLHYGIERGDASQATAQVLDYCIQKNIGEKIYTMLIRDPKNLGKAPVAVDIHVFPDGTIQAAEVNPDDIECQFDIDMSQ